MSFIIMDVKHRPSVIYLWTSLGIYYYVFVDFDRLNVRNTCATTTTIAARVNENNIKDDNTNIQPPTIIYISTHPT